MIISAYTPNYKKYADVLEASLKKYALAYELVQYDSTGKWSTNCQFKAVFIKSMLEKYNKVFWVDSDAEIVSFPDLFYGPHFPVGDEVFDIACHYLKTTYNDSELLTGVLGFCNTEKAHEILNEWIRYNENNPKQWDQWTLSGVLNKTDNVNKLEIPVEYFDIEGYAKYQGKIENPIVHHYQASREMRNCTQ